MHHTFEMGVGPKGKLLTFTSAIQIVFMLCYVATSYACPEKCDCKQMGSLGFIIKCNGIMQVPRGLPVKTLMLDLSRNFLKAVPQDIFRNLTSLKSINLDNNNIKGGFYLPKSVTKITISKNRLSLDDLRTVLAKPKDVQVLDISENPIGPNLTADVFHGLEKMMLLKMTNCSLRYIQSGTFRSMKILSKLNLDNNLLLQIQASTLEGPGSELSKLSLENNNLLTIADGTFVRFSGLVDLSLNKNQLQTPPNLAGVTNLHELFLNTNQIRDISQLSNYNITRVALLGLSGNQIEQLPVDVFQKIAVAISLDLSLNNITLIPEEAFLACETLSEL